MSKAEERALEAYPPKMRYVGIDSVKYDRKIDVNKPMRDRYVKAYHQAEKDLELTWEDISAIRHTMARLRRQFSNDNQVVNNEEFCKEVLNCFRAQKGK